VNPGSAARASSPGALKKIERHKVRKIIDASGRDMSTRGRRGHQAYKRSAAAADAGADTFRGRSAIFGQATTRRVIDCR